MGNRFIEAFKARYKQPSDPSGAEQNEANGASLEEAAPADRQDRVATSPIEGDREASSGSPRTAVEASSNEAAKPASWHLVLPGYEFTDGTLRAKSGRAAPEETRGAETPSSDVTSESQKGKKLGVRAPLAFGLSAGCLIALLGLRLGNADSEREPSRSAAVAVAAPVPCTPATTSAAFNIAALTSVLPPLLPTAAAATTVVPDVMPLEAAVSENPEPPVEIAAGESPASEPLVRAPAKPKARSNTRIEMETRQVMVSGRAVAAVIMLKRTGSKHGRTRVRWKTLPGTAAPAKDYESVSKTVQFADGQAQRTIFVPIMQQPPGAESRTFSVVLERAPRGSPLGSVRSTTVTILGDG